MQRTLQLLVRGADIAARWIAQKLTDRLNQKVFG
jgi:hypothetical protein